MGVQHAYGSSDDTTAASAQVDQADQPRAMAATNATRRTRPRRAPIPFPMIRFEPATLTSLSDRATSTGEFASDGQTVTRAEVTARPSGHVTAHQEPTNS